METSWLRLDNVTLRVEVSIPQLDTLTTALVQALSHLGDALMDSLEPLRVALASLETSLTTAIETELGQVTEALREAQNVEEIQALAEEIDAARQRLTTQVSTMIPDVPPAPGA